MKLYKADIIATIFTTLFGFLFATIFTFNNINSNLRIALFVAICTLAFRGFYNRKFGKQKDDNSEIENI
jgi:hypothetical protein